MSCTHYSLPYDYSRCSGGYVEKVMHTSCTSCLRRLAPGHEYRQSFFMTAPVEESGYCKYFIKAES